MLYLPMQNPFLFDPNCSLWLQFKEHLRVLGKENSLYPLKPVINCLCLTKFELKQTLNTEKYGKECVAWESQDFLFYHPTLWKDTFLTIWLSDTFDYLVMIIEFVVQNLTWYPSWLNTEKKRTWSVYQKTYCLSHTVFKCLKLLV